MADLTVMAVLKKLGKDILGWVKSNCVNNLVSTATNLPLAANQGKVLDEKIDEINQSLNGVTIYSIEDIDGFYFNPYKLCIGYLIQDDNAYLEFDISWIHLQLRIINNGFGFEWRVKFGDSAWYDWSTM